MIAALVFALASTQSPSQPVGVPSPTHLAVAPWTGAQLPTATSAAKTYRLTVTGTPNATLALAVSGLKDGWIGAFCTPHLCAPMRVTLTLPPSGQAVYQFELIREDDTAPKHTTATITTSDGATLSLSP